MSKKFFQVLILFVILFVFAVCVMDNNSTEKRDQAPRMLGATYMGGNSAMEQSYMVGIESFHLQQAETSAKSILKHYNADIQNINTTKTKFSVDFFVKPLQLPQLMKQLKTLGHVIYLRSAASNQAVNLKQLEQQIQSKKYVQERLTRYLHSTKDIKNLVDIEKQLDSVTAQLNSLNTQMSQLKKGLTHSKVSFTILAKQVNVSLPLSSDFGIHLLWNYASFWQYLIVILIYLIICGIPIVFILFLFSLLFKKMHRRCQKKHQEHQEQPKDKS